MSAPCETIAFPAPQRRVYEAIVKRYRGALLNAEFDSISEASGAVLQELKKHPSAEGIRATVLDHTE